MSIIQSCIYHKVWWLSDRNCGRSSVLKFLVAVGSHVNESEKKCKKFENEKFLKTDGGRLRHDSSSADKVKQS